MLSLMKLSTCSRCPLCGVKQCTLFHILVNCSKALRDKRYTWRHDSVIATLLQILVPRLIAQNAEPPSSQLWPRIQFVKANANPSKTVHQVRKRCSILSVANDWQLLADFDHCRMLFPVEICSTNERPDIVIWSFSAKTVILVELTCPAEENIDAAAAKKTARYQALVELISSHWTVHLRTVEAEPRGSIAHSFRKLFR